MPDPLRRALRSLLLATAAAAGCAMLYGIAGLAIGIVAKDAGIERSGFDAFFAGNTALAVAAIGLVRMHWAREARHKRDADLLPLDDGGDEPIVGYRVWRIAETAEGIRLRSWFRRKESWTPGASMDAAIDKGQGIHAFATKADLREEMRWYRGGPKIYGKVALWGGIVECERGYRAEHAYPVVVYAHDLETARRVGRAYGCEAFGASRDLREMD